MDGSNGGHYSRDGSTIICFPMRIPWQRLTRCDASSRKLRWVRTVLLGLPRHSDRLRNFKVQAQSQVALIDIVTGLTFFDPTITRPVALLHKDGSHRWPPECGVPEGNTGTITDEQELMIRQVQDNHLSIPVAGEGNGQVIVLHLSDHEFLLVGYRASVSLKDPVFQWPAMKAILVEKGYWSGDRWVKDGAPGYDVNQSNLTLNLDLEGPQAVRVSW